MGRFSPGPERGAMGGTNRCVPGKHLFLSARIGRAGSSIPWLRPKPRSRCRGSAVDSRIRRPALANNRLVT